MSQPSQPKEVILLSVVHQMTILRMDTNRNKIYDFISDMKPLFRLYSSSKQTVLAEITAAVQKGLLTDSDKQGQSKKGAVRLTETGRAVIKTSSVVVNADEAIVSDQGNTQTCALHAVSKAVKRGMDNFVSRHEVKWRPDFDDVRKALMQFVSMETIQNLGMDPNKIDNTEIKLELTARCAPVAVLVEMIVLESLPEGGVEMNEGFNFVVSVGINDDNEVDENEDEDLHLLHVLEVGEEEVKCSNSWGNFNDVLRFPKTLVKNTWRVRTWVSTE